MKNLYSFAAIILSSGRGERVNYSEPKQYSNIGGIPIIRRSIKPFLLHSDINHIVLVINPKDEKFLKNIFFDIKSKISIIHGGNNRQESSFLGLKYLENNPPDYVHIHDGVRPFITKDNIDDIHREINETTGILLGIPISDTLKLINNFFYVLCTIYSKNIYCAQTPQSFPYSLILRAHKKAFIAGKNNFTDDSSIAEWDNIPMKIIESSKKNIKITWKEDIIRSNNNYFKKNIIYPDIRIGHGYDSHKYIQGTNVTLCGVNIPFNKKLDGHSDADVALHALTDAVLATNSEGDIGKHFPSSNKKWHDIKSEVFLKHAINIISKNNGYIINVDITLILEYPKIYKYRIIMINSLEKILDISRNRISIKAKTNEKMGFIGRKEGIAALATVSIFYENIF